MERGSERIESQDLIKAIYMVDLEHVVTYWNNWEAFEAFVLSNEEGYVNRILYLVQVEMIRAKMEGAQELAGISNSVLEIVSAARKLASDKIGAPATPSSRELLFCACSLDSQLSESLQQFGLNFAKLAESVKK